MVVLGTPHSKVGDSVFLVPLVGTVWVTLLVDSGRFSEFSLLAFNRPGGGVHRLQLGPAHFQQVQLLVQFVQHVFIRHGMLLVGMAFSSVSFGQAQVQCPFVRHCTLSVDATFGLVGFWQTQVCRLSVDWMCFHQAQFLSQAFVEPDVLSVSTFFGLWGAWLDLQVRLCICVGICRAGLAQDEKQVTWVVVGLQIHGGDCTCNYAIYSEQQN